MTIVEVLVTIVVVGIGLMAAVMCLNSALIANQRANRIAVATMAANQVMNDVRSQRVAAYIIYMQNKATAQPALGITVTVNGTTTTVAYPMPAMSTTNAQNQTVTSSQLQMTNAQVSAVLGPFSDVANPGMAAKLNTVTVTVSWTGNAKQAESVVLSSIVSNRIT